ncbi:hypothetical protein LX16_5032 [Stackebrandtia albiflava]|uniref:Transglycosylase-like protein with SLT domain n=2 Tax=Stackebrandtia albiflava TaxID=406432 RepID=A0A562UPK4_9ACTN|nr:hypothetical protein LX16_5032 [Stackebrandtia albiflava]
MACRAFAVILLLAGVGFGIHIGLTGEEGIQDPRQSAEEDLRAADAEQQATRDWHRDYALTAADTDAEAKAENIAQVASDQAKALDDTFAAVQEAEEAEEQSGSGSVDIGPIPEDCNGYSGNKAAGCTLLLEHGFGLDQMPCLEQLWDKESGWNEHAHNPSSGAHGIPQALPGNQMASVGDDWETNPITQITWGLQYISNRYGTPCDAWAHSQEIGWY